MFRPLDPCAREGRDRLVAPLSPEEGVLTKERVFHEIRIGRRVAIARSWSLDDSAAGMGGAKQTSETGPVWS